MAARNGRGGRAAPLALSVKVATHCGLGVALQLILTIALPIFVLILAGYLSARRGFIDRAGIQGLTGFVFYFTLPLMLFHDIANAPVAEKFDGAYALAYLASGLVIHCAGFFVARRGFKRPWSDGAILGISGCFGATVFIALPIASELFGDAASLPMAMAITIENGILMPLTIALLEIENARRGGIWQATNTALKAILRNPIVMSVLLGAAVALLGFKLPVLLDGIVNLVRGANFPCALFALGATFAGLPLAARVHETGFMVVMKLLVYPGLVYVVLLAFLPDLDPVWRAVGVISAAVPIGPIVYLAAVRYEAYVAQVSTAVLASAVLSVVSISALVVAFG